MKLFPILFGLLFSVSALAAPIYVSPGATKGQVVAAGPDPIEVCYYEKIFTGVAPTGYDVEWVCKTFPGAGAADPLVIDVAEDYSVRISGARWAWEYNSLGDLVPMAVFDNEF